MTQAPSDPSERMSRPESDEDPRADRLAAWAAAPPPPGAVDELEQAKLNLLQLASDGQQEQPGLVNRHPYAFVTGALAAGMLIGRVPMLRRVFFKAASWGASAYAQKALRQWMG